MIALAILEPASEIRDPSDPSADESTAKKAFDTDYETHADDAAFLDHLEKQRSTFLERKQQAGSVNAPFFAVIQSSGYGKSRLINRIMLDKPQNYNVIYWSFASESAYPRKNVAISDPTFSTRKRETLEKAFQNEISMAVVNILSGKPQGGVVVSIKRTDAKPQALQQPETGKKIIFVVDEASMLLDKFTVDGVSYYRALRSAFKNFEANASWLFFVVMSTFSSITYLSPGLTTDPSWKPTSGYNDENQTPLDPFILGSSFRVNNDRDKILAMTVEQCHVPKCLYSMGRPLWKALLTCDTPMTDEALLDYGRKKLRHSKKTSSDLVVPEEILAVLSVRLCLSISPTSLYGPSLVARHMATALSVTEDRMSMVVTYPSEPVLAAGAKLFMRNQDNISQMISALQVFLAHGVVDKGYKGEIIVRLLMMLAIDKAMGNENVKEVSLKEYLLQFSRERASLDEVIEGLDSIGRQEIDVETELGKLRRLKIDWSDSRAILQRRKEENSSRAASRPLTYADGQVCFTHFVYLSKSTEGPLVTHDLLRYAYRRGAAIVVEEGRRGIDKIIPLRVGEDKFVGLVIQDKNRVSDTLQSLTSFDNDETHHKVNLEYFLSKEEKQTFRSAGVDLTKHWPAILFAVGVDEVGAAAAGQLEQRRFRHNNRSETEGFHFPCIVLVGLNYTNLMNAEADKHLSALRDFEIVPSDRKRADIPITYGR